LQLSLDDDVAVALAIRRVKCGIVPRDRGHFFLEGSPIFNAAERMPSGGRHEHMRSFSREEDILMFASIERNQTARGISWIKVAEEMGKTNERTPAMLRNRFYRYKLGKIAAKEGTARNRCAACGEIKSGHDCKGQAGLVASVSIEEQKREHEQKREQLATAEGADDLQFQQPLAPVPVVSFVSHGFVPIAGDEGLFAPLPLDIAEAAFPNQPAPLVRGWSISSKGEDLPLPRITSFDLGMAPVPSPP